MRKKDRTDEGHDFSGMPAPKTLTPADVQAKEFGVSRFGGYRMRDVDEFLDELTTSMTKLTEENERLRSGAILPAAPIGAPDLADTSRQADEIIERARAEAARIVRDAEDRAATATGAAGSMSASDRAAVTAFLSREREFLQSLAGLVQGHAEAIKGMARAARPARAPQDEVAPAADGSEPTVDDGSEPTVDDGSEPTEDEGPPTEHDASPTEETAPEEPSRDEPIRVDEPAAAAVSRGEADDEADPADGEGDRSLRELFWGEE